MKVLFVASEAAPFVKTGGLGDVIGSLPKYLNKLGIDTRVILPCYSDISEYYREEMETVTTTTVTLGWRKQSCRLLKLASHETNFYFLDNKYYFDREGLYGHHDDGERFAFFCKAVLDLINYLDFRPDIIHCHDWHAGIISPLLKAKYQGEPDYQNLKTLFTIHNLHYQGTFPKLVAEDMLSFRDDKFLNEYLECDDLINFLKSGVLFSDYISTVSPTYASEIQTPYFGEGLDTIFRERNSDLAGILNGIDYDEFNPETDDKIYYNYSYPYLGKEINKEELQREVGLPVKKDIPLFAFVNRLVAQKGLDLIKFIIPEALNQDMQFIVLGTGDKEYEHYLKELESRFPTQVASLVYFDESMARRIYAGSDLFLMPSLFEPCGIGQMIALRYGTVPVVRETGGLNDTVTSFSEITGEGNGFTFSNFNAHDLLFVINRALEFYHRKDLWPQILKNTVKHDLSWVESAKKYENVYQKLCHQAKGAARYV